jgi:hypothetical protein
MDMTKGMSKRPIRCHIRIIVMGQSFVAGGLVTRSAALRYGHIVAHTATCPPLPSGRFPGMLQRQNQACSPSTLTNKVRHIPRPIYAHVG